MYAACLAWLGAAAGAAWQLTAADNGAKNKKCVHDGEYTM